MTTTRTTEEVAATISARRADLDAQLSDLGNQLDAASLSITEGNADASKQVAGFKQQMTEIRDELESLDAAGRALQKRREEEAKAARAQEVITAREAIPSGVRSVEAAYLEVEAAIAALGAAWAKLEDSVGQLNNVAWTCERPIFNPDHGGAPNRLSMDLVSNMAGKLLWQVTGDKLQPVAGNFDNRPDTPEDVRERIKYALDRVAANSEQLADRSVQAIRA